MEDPVVPRFDPDISQEGVAEPLSDAGDACV